jgi:hypothetical protein
MTSPELRDLYQDHQGKVSDRWSLYLREYQRILSSYREKRINLLEIGVQNGGSLELWGKFFPGAERIVGCDVNPRCGDLQFDDKRIQVVVGSAVDESVRERILALLPTIDIVIDDGSHQSRDIIAAFFGYFPRIVDGGVFIAEDMHCSYWSKFEGGLFHPLSSISLFKTLGDVVNREHWGIQTEPRELLDPFYSHYGIHISDEDLRHVHSVEFVNSMCVVRKEQPGVNDLGNRFVTGKIADVDPGHWELHASKSYALDQSDNPWARRPRPLDRLRNLAGKLRRVTR